MHFCLYICIYRLFKIPILSHVKILISRAYLHEINLLVIDFEHRFPFHGYILRYIAYLINAIHSRIKSQSMVNRHYHVEITGGTRVIVQRSNACFSKFFGSRGLPSLGSLRPSIRNAKWNIYMTATRSGFRFRLEISWNSNLIEVTIFLLIIQGESRVTQSTRSIVISCRVRRKSYRWTFRMPRTCRLSELSYRGDS